MRRLLHAAAAAIVVLAAACSGGPQRFVVGLAVASDVHPAVELAARRINETGGVRGVPLELAGMDWLTVSDVNPEDLLAWAERFAEDEDVVAVIGHEDSLSSLVAAPYYESRKLPHVATIASHPAVTKSGGWTYRLCPSDELQGRVLAEHAIETWGQSPFAVFFVNDDYGRGLATVFRRHVESLGGRVSAFVSHRNVIAADDEELIRLTLERLAREEKPAAVILFQRISASIWTVQTMREMGFEMPVLGGDAVGHAAVLQARLPWMNGVLTTQFFDVDSAEPPTRTFVSAIRAMTGEEPRYAQAFAYDALGLVRDAVEAEGFTRAGVKRHLDRLIRDKTVVHGVTGRFTLGEDRNARRPLFLGEIRGHEFRLLTELVPGPLRASEQFR